VEVMGELPGRPIPIMIGINDWDLPDGKIGSFKFPDVEGQAGILTVSPRAFDEVGAPYWWVVTHELIHVLMGRESKDNPHNDDFQAIANILGVPEKYRD
jgi:hypothetical protein